MSGSIKSINGFSARELQTIYASTGCSDPGILRLDKNLLFRFHPEWSGMVRKFSFYLLEKLLGIKNPVESVRWHLLLGDRAPAIVASVTPFIVAAYSEEQDCIVLLTFDTQNVDPKFRSVGTRLTALNLDYSSSYGPLAADLQPGPRSTGRWSNFLPLIGEFLSRDDERLAQLQASIPRSWWPRLVTLVNDYAYERGIRDGRPGFAAQPTVGDHIWRMIDRGS